MNVREFLDERHVAFHVITHRETFDAQRLAEALHVPGRQIAKTVLLRADSGFAYVLAVIPAPRQVDLRRVGQLLGGSRLELATEDEVVDVCPGAERGVLPPFGSLLGVQTVVDSQLAGGGEIVFEGTTHHDAIRMSFADFLQLEQPLIGKLTAGDEPPAGGDGQVK